MEGTRRKWIVGTLGGLLFAAATVVGVGVGNPRPAHAGLGTIGGLKPGSCSECVGNVIKTTRPEKLCYFEGTTGGSGCAGSCNIINGSQVCSCYEFGLCARFF